MKFLSKQIMGLLAAIMAAACCLDLSNFMMDLGVGYYLPDHHQYELPLFASLVGLSIFSLFIQSVEINNMSAFYLACLAGLISIAALWMHISGIPVSSLLLIVSLLLVFSSFIWQAFLCHEFHQKKILNDDAVV